MRFLIKIKNNRALGVLFKNTAIDVEVSLPSEFSGKWPTVLAVFLRISALGNWIYLIVMSPLGLEYSELPG